MIPPPKLDDRTFDDIVDEAISMIPRYAPEWTNHNPSDPGITLIELAAWMTDLLIYRPDQWFLAEIKSWRDKLNENQKRWIEDNHRYLHLPFKLVQVHRLECNVSSV